MTRYITYGRVSVSEKYTGSCSREWQQEQCAGWLKLHHAAAAGEYFDDGVSAMKPLAERKQGREAFKLAAGEGAVIIAAKQDRVFRDVQDFLASMLPREGTAISCVFVNDNLDLTTAMGRAMGVVRAVFAQLEREQVGERTKATIGVRKAAGLAIGGHLPYGFKVVEQGGGGLGDRTDKVLVRDEQEQKALENIKTWHSRGLPLRKIAEGLQAAGYPTRKGGPWSHATVQYILRDLAARTRKKKGKAAAAGEAEEE